MRPDESVAADSPEERRSLEEGRSPEELRRLANLEAFALLFGVVRYFHPSDEAAAADWDAVALRGVELVEGAADTSELAWRLRASIGDVAPTVRILVEPPDDASAPGLAEELVPSEPPDGASRFRAWRHVGWGQGVPDSIYRSDRLDVPLRPNPLDVFRRAPSPPEDLPRPGEVHREILGDEILGNGSLGNGSLRNGSLGNGSLGNGSLGNGSLGNRVVALVPLAVWRDDAGTLPRPAKAVEPGPAAGSEAESVVDPTAEPAPGGALGTLEPGPRSPRTTGLAAVVVAWNVFEHFYPYAELIETEPRDGETPGGALTPVGGAVAPGGGALTPVGGAVAPGGEADQGTVTPRLEVSRDPLRGLLRDALARMARIDDDGDEADRFDALERLVAGLQDGHGRVVPPEPPRRPPFALLWEVVEGQLVVTRVGARSPPDLSAGDVVVRIDSRPALEVLAEAEERVSGATAGWRRREALTRLLWRSDDGTTLDVELGRGESRRIVLAAAHREFLREDRPPKLARLEDGIQYVDLDRLDDAEFRAALPTLAEADGIIFDLRGYPGRLSTLPLAHLTDEPLTSAEWHVPLVVRPHREEWSFVESSWKVSPRSPRLRARVAFITDARAISYAETWLGIVEHYRLGEIVGEVTAGTNGNVNPFTVPGGYRIIWTGMKVLKHGGLRHHGVGILPTVPVTRTSTGIAAGRDELLERALESVRGQRSP